MQVFTPAIFHTLTVGLFEKFNSIWIQSEELLRYLDERHQNLP